MRVAVQLQGGQPAAVGRGVRTHRQVPAVGDVEDSLGELRVLAQVLVEQLRTPQVVGALGMLTGLVQRVGVQARRETATGQRHLVGQPADDAAHHPLEQFPLLCAIVWCRPQPATGVGAEQQRIVVEHLLEVRHLPVGVDAVAVEAAADLVVEATASHRLEGEQHPIVAQRIGAHEQGVQHRRLRELGCTTEAAVAGVELGVHLGEQPMRGEVGLRDGQQRRPVQVGHALDDGGRRVGHLVPTFRPSLGEHFDQFTEGRQATPRFGREVGAGEERFTRRRAEDRHRPAALAGESLGRAHERLVDVGVFLTVDLDGDEVLVDEGADLGVGEGFAGHHVTPVTRRVADAHQDQHVTSGRLGEGLRPPVPPINRVVGVLA